jgi:hypothetical protein
VLSNRDEGDVVEAVKRKATAAAPFDLAMLDSSEQGGSAGPAEPRGPQALASTRSRTKPGWAESAKTGVLEAMARGAMEVARWSQDQLAMEDEDDSDDPTPVSDEAAGRSEEESQPEPPGT